MISNEIYLKLLTYPFLLRSIMHNGFLSSLYPMMKNVASFLSYGDASDIIIILWMSISPIAIRLLKESMPNFQEYFHHFWFHNSEEIIFLRDVILLSMHHWFWHRTNFFCNGITLLTSQFFLQFFPFLLLFTIVTVAFSYFSSIFFIHFPVCISCSYPFAIFFLFT